MTANGAIDQTVGSLPDRVILGIVSAYAAAFICSGSSSTVRNLSCAACTRS
jgi:hypothetical protein